MQRRWTISRKSGIVWAALLLLTAGMLSPKGSWTIDDSIKRIAAEYGQGMWAETVRTGPLRGALADPDNYPALHAPFAVHGPEGYLIGFSPWTRALFKLVRSAGEWCWKFFPMAAILALWIVLEGQGMAWAFLLMPLTFYGLVPWEHGLSWLLLWPAVAVVFADDNTVRLWPMKALMYGFLMAAACLLRPESVILAAGLLIFLVMQKQFRSVIWLGLGTAAGVAGLTVLHGIDSKSGAWIQIGYNLIGSKTGGARNWLMQRPQACYELLLRMDGNVWASGMLLVLLGAGVWLLLRGEKENNKPTMGLGFGLLVICAALYQYRLWHSATPVLTIMGANSLAASLPWVALLVVPPYRNRPAFWLAVGCIAAAIVLTPVWEGVHWGPRILLFAVPLLLIDLKRTGRMRGVAFAGLLGLTLIQTVGSTVLVFARYQETGERNGLLESKLGSPVICPTMSQCADLAPLWGKREFFTAATPRELKQLLIEFRFQKVDTVWLHLDAFDPLYVDAFPEAKPVWPYRMTVLRGGSLYKTPWRVYELVMNRKDSLWTGILEGEAGQCMAAKKPEAALRLEKEAVVLSPKAAQVHQNLAVILAALNRRDEARDEARTALDLNSGLAEPRRLLDILDSLPRSGP